MVIKKRTYLSKISFSIESNMAIVYRTTEIVGFNEDSSFQILSSKDDTLYYDRNADISSEDEIVQTFINFYRENYHGLDDLDDMVSKYQELNIEPFT